MKAIRPLVLRTFSFLRFSKRELVRRSPGSIFFGRITSSYGKAASSPRAGVRCFASVTRILIVMLAVSVQLLLARGAVSAPASAEPTPSDRSQPLTKQLPQGTKLSLEDWRKILAGAPQRGGCFNATYPNTAWRQVKCAKAPPVPYPPALGRASQIVGGGSTSDSEGQLSAPNLMHSVWGSFTSVIGATNETGTDPFTGTTDVPNTFSLQLNTNKFPTAACAHASNPAGCQGWQQFVYSNIGRAFIQYWLIGFGPCPFSWNGDGGVNCFKNSAAAYIPVQSITHLDHLLLTGEARSGGMDSIEFQTADFTMSRVSVDDNVLGLAQGWQEAEFNIFGDCCATGATFNDGAKIAIQLKMDNTTLDAPMCNARSWTGETNSLNLVPSSCCPFGGSATTISFSESNVVGATSHCAFGTSVFDP